MAFKCIGYGRGDDYRASLGTSFDPLGTESFEPANNAIREPQPTIEGNLVALIGDIINGESSTTSEHEHMERLEKVTDHLLMANMSVNRTLNDDPNNDQMFKQYVGLPFTKGVTERVTGRTLLILGSNAHHIEAMQNQYAGVVWMKDVEEEIALYGDTLRWINIGNVAQGFIGLDYNPDAPYNAGVANTELDMKFLARRLIEIGFDHEKKMFLLSPPYIIESRRGTTHRKRGIETIGDYASLQP